MDLLDMRAAIVKVALRRAFSRRAVEKVTVGRSTLPGKNKCHQDSKPTEVSGESTSTDRY